MKIKLIITAILAFVLGHDIAIMRTTRKVRALQTTHDREVKEAQLLGFALGMSKVVNDKVLAEGAYKIHNPDSPSDS
jgi:hypothetical protein